ncbi:MlaD family protein [Ottowia sp.]|uniref:MlaD family protein n=1 Tax=Ottowia sp. TaxID=1898956 RepID=UPI003A86CAA3
MSALSSDSAAALPLDSDRAQRRLERRAVLLLLTMALLIAGAVLYLMWARGAFEQTQALVLTADDSDGVSVGMDMTFSGFPIGRVRRIELAAQGTVRILVDVPVKDAHWLRTSSVFTLEKGLVGAARLRAFTGIADDPPLPAGAERMVLRGDVSAEIPRMVADVRDVLQNAKRMTDEGSSLSQTLEQVRTLAEKLNSTQGGVMGALTGNEADARRLGELLARSSQLVKNLDAVAQRTDGLLKKADQQVLGDNGLVTDARATVQQLNTLLQGVGQSLTKVDGMLKDAQATASNARAASANLGDLRADVEASLARIDALITELNRQWPFAPKAQEVELP